MDLTSRLFMMAASGGGPSSGYWYATLGSAQSEIGVGIRAGSDDSLYIKAFGGGYVYAAKYATDGALTWQRRIATATGPSDTRQLAIDSSDSIYFAYADTGTSTDSIYAVAYNSSGALQWQKRWNGNSRFGLQDGAYAVCYGSDIYVSSRRFSQFGESAVGNGTAWLIKAATSTGAVTWSNNTYNLDNYAYAVTVDSSENIYMAHEVDQGGTPNIGQLAVSKFNAAGARAWISSVRGESYSFAGTTYYRTIAGESVELDSSTNIYVAGRKLNTSDVTRAAIFKFNSSGTIQWARALGTTAGSYYGVTTDSSGNIYACGNVSGVAVVVSYDSSGNINWQRSWAGGVGDGFRSIDIDSNGDLCICGNTSSAGEGSNDILLVKLPADGSLTGTYGNFTYAASTYTNATEVANAYSSGAATYSQSVTVTNSSFSETAGSLVSDTTNL